MTDAPKRILIVEDDRFIGEMYSKALQSAGFIVKWILDGTNATIIAQSSPFDLVLLDIMLPGKMGGEILNELRANPATANVRVIVATNFEQSPDSRSNMESKADGYLIKADITPHRLVDMVKDLLSK